MFKTPQFPDTQSFVAILLVVAMVALTFTLVFVKVPDSDVFKMLAGGLLSVGFSTIIGFYFGSSTGSKDKDQAMSSAVTALTANANTNPPAPVMPPEIKAALAFVAVLIASLIFSAPAFAQITKPKLPFDPLHLNQQQANPKGTPSTDPEVACDFRIFIGLTPANLEQAIKQCVSDVNSTLADDTSRALASAVAYPDNDAINCLKPGLAILQAGQIIPAVPAIPGQDAVPANPNATPPTAAIPAVAAVPAIPAKNPGLILLFQKYREFILSGGLTSCQTWVNTPVNATIAQGLNNAAGIAGAAAGAALLIPKP